MELLQDARYQDTPVYLFFEKYVLDVIGKLPQDKIEILQQINLQATFGTHSSEWKDVIREVLKLSSTIDIAVLSYWYKKREIAQAQGITIDPDLFSKEFVDAYFEENSVIDVWTEKTLTEAKELIYENQMLENA